MKKIVLVVLVWMAALFLLPFKHVFSQVSDPSLKPVASPSPSPTVSPKTKLQKMVKKTGSVTPVKVKKVNQPVPPAEFDPMKTYFYPPSETFVPSNKTQIMLRVICSEKDRIWASTESFTPFFASFIKFELNGKILVLQPNGEYTPYDLVPSEPASIFRPEDVKFSEQLIKTIKPKRFTLMPKLVALEKDNMELYDPYKLVELLRDHMGREGYDVNVLRESNCYKLPPPPPTPTPTPTPTPSLTISPTPIPTETLGKPDIPEIGG